MTDIRKKQDNRSAKTKKLQLHRETLKDLSVSKTAQVKGGAGTDGGEKCTQRWSDCTIG